MLLLFIHSVSVCSTAGIEAPDFAVFSINMRDCNYSAHYITLCTACVHGGRQQNDLMAPSLNCTYLCQIMVFTYRYSLIQADGQ